MWSMGFDPFCTDCIVIVRMKEKQAMRYVGCLGLLVGLASIFGGFFYDVIFAGIPYQDPTPELQQRYDFHAGVVFYIEITGVLIMAIGSLL